MIALLWVRERCPAVHHTSASEHLGSDQQEGGQIVTTFTLIAPGGVRPQCMFVDLKQKFTNVLSHQLVSCRYQLIKDVHAPILQKSHK